MKTLLASLLVLAAVTTGSNALSSPATNLEVTKNVLPLRGTGKNSLLQKRDGQNAVAVAPVRYIEAGFTFVTDITVSGKSYPVEITTSSNTWLAVNDVSCIDFITEKPGPCKFGPLYDPRASKTLEEVQGQVFNLSYYGEESWTGKVGLETIAVAGISVPKMAFGMVDAAYYTGNGVTSGVLGISYKPTWAIFDEDSATSAHPKTIPYDSLFVQMFDELGVPPVFSLSLQQGGTGMLAIGGIPDALHESKFYDAALVNGSVDATGKTSYYSYEIKIDGYAVSKSKDTDGSNDPAQIPLVGKGTVTTISLGTALVYAPDKVGALVASSFDPPGNYDDDLGAWAVDCTAVPPKFGVSIQGKVFYVKPENMMVPLNDGGCMSGVRPNGGRNELGSNWMMEVLSVFDIGAGKMRFAAVEN